MAKSAPINSPNFSFLNEHDPLLVIYAARAERYVFDDANTSLLKLRQFAELLARHAAARCGMETETTDFRDVVAMLVRQRIVTREVRELFDLLRLRGNDAA